MLWLVFNMQIVVMFLGGSFAYLVTTDILNNVAVLFSAYVLSLMSGIYYYKWNHSKVDCWAQNEDWNCFPPT